MLAPVSRSAAGAPAVAWSGAPGAGTLRLRVPLGPGARRALARRGRLALRVRVTVSAPGRATGTARRRVTLRSVKSS